MEKYQYIEKIGSGSYGEVSLIKDKKDQKKYVVKKVSLLGSYRYVQGSTHHSRPGFRLRVVHTQAILLLRSMAERGGSDIERL